MSERGRQTGGKQRPVGQSDRRGFWRLCCLTLAFFGLFTVTALAQGAPKDTVAAIEGVKVEILWGDNNLVRIGQDAPITVRVSSSGAELEGTARVTVPMGENQYYVLEEPLTVAAGETKQAILCVPVTYYTDIVSVEFRGTDGLLYAARNVKLRADHDSQEIYVAVISSDVGQLASFDRVVLNEYQGATTRLFDFKEDTLPVDADVLKLYDIFLWDDVDPQRISEEQMAALNSWVYEGGVLIIGSDSRWRDDVEEMEILREGWGRGQYVYCGFSLREASLKYEGGIRGFLYDSVGESRMNAIEENIDGAYQDYWSAANVTSGVDAARIPQVWQYAIVLVVYLVLLGPVLYYILKKKKRRNLLRGAMVGLALVFTAIIYIMGGRTRFYRPFVSYASIREIRSGLLVETVYANVSSPSNAAYSLDVAPGYEVSPLASYEYRQGSDLSDSSCRMRLRESVEGTQVWIYEGIPFTREMLRLTGMGSSPYGDGFSGEITLLEDRFEGILRNESDETFEQVCILSGGRVALIGELEAGASVDLSQIETHLIYGQDQTKLLEAMAGVDQYETVGESREASETVWRYRVLSDYFSNRMLDEEGEAIVMAFPAAENVSCWKSQNVDVQGTTLVTETISLQYQKNGQRYQPMTESRIDVLQGSYQFARNSTTEALCVLRYDLGEIQADRLIVIWPEKPEASEYMKAFDQELEFYNWETRSYEAMERKQTYQRQELEPYLDEENRLTVRFAMATTESYYYEVFLPNFSVVGRVSR